MELLYIIFGIFLIVAIITYQFKVCYKYLFKYSLTKIDDKSITIQKKVIPFASIENVIIEEVDINLIERFLVSVMFFNGVYKMVLNLNNGIQEMIVLPKNYIIKFCEKLEAAGVSTIGY